MNELLYRFRTAVMVSVLRALSRPDQVTLGGIDVEIARGVHHPAPFAGIGFQPLQEAALRELAAGARVLELGTGAGFWALAAARRGCVVTATDLPHVPLEPVQRAAQRLGVELRTVHSDLFAELAGERFDAILFNPPFHDASPRTSSEHAWCGGDVVRRFLRELPAHLAPGGAAYVLMPRADQQRYERELAALEVRSVASRWYPLLGRSDLLAIRPSRAAP